jgi:hypothetical protein
LIKSKNNSTKTIDSLIEKARFTTHCQKCDAKVDKNTQIRIQQIHKIKWMQLQNTSDLINSSINKQKATTNEACTFLHACVHFKNHNNLTV